MNQSITNTSAPGRFIPTHAVQNHAANLLPLPNGDVLCTWFCGTQEGMADIFVALARLKAGESAWSDAVIVSEDPARSEQNPVLFLAPNGALWLLYTAQKAGNQDTAIVRCRISEDMGQTWGPVRTLFEDPETGIFIRQPIVVLGNGDWLLPVFYCRRSPGEKWTGNRDDSAVKISCDNGKSWHDHPVPGSTGCVHMNIVPLPDGSLVALFRSRWADHIYLSRSHDNGRTWTPPEPTQLPNNNSSIQATLLHSGHLALVFNDMNAENCRERRTSLYDEIEDEEEAAPTVPGAKPLSPAREAFWGAPRAPLTLALSADGGKSWPYKRNLEIGDGYCMTNNSQNKENREYSYPSIKQAADGKIHIAYTWFRQKIKHVCIDENWITHEKTPS